MLLSMPGGGVRGPSRLVKTDPEEMRMPFLAPFTVVKMDVPLAGCLKLFEGLKRGKNQRLQTGGRNLEYSRPSNRTKINFLLNCLRSLNVHKMQAPTCFQVQYSVYLPFVIFFFFFLFSFYFGHLC